jgi:hypothetical protein
MNDRIKNKVEHKPETFVWCSFSKEVTDPLLTSASPCVQPINPFREARVQWSSDPCSPVKKARNPHKQMQFV